MLSLSKRFPFTRSIWTIHNYLHFVTVLLTSIKLPFNACVYLFSQLGIAAMHQTQSFLYSRPIEWRRLRKRFGRPLYKTLTCKVDVFSRWHSNIRYQHISYILVINITVRCRNIYIYIYDYSVFCHVFTCETRYIWDWSPTYFHVYMRRDNSFGAHSRWGNIAF